MVEVIAYHLRNGAIVKIEDSKQPRAVHLRYEVRPIERATQLIDAHGRQIGIFANLAALVDHAEAVTATS